MRCFPSAKIVIKVFPFYEAVLPIFALLKMDSENLLGNKALSPLQILVSFSYSFDKGPELRSLACLRVGKPNTVPIRSFVELNKIEATIRDFLFSLFTHN